MDNSPYETLGVDNKATKDNIRKAYRKRARKSHPDVGGDKDEFIKLNQAYKLLVDDGRRKRYDETGKADDDNMGLPIQMAQGLVTSFFMEAVIKHFQMDGESFDKDYVTLVKNAIEAETRGKVTQIGEIKHSVRFMRSVKSRLTRKTKKKEPSVDMLSLTLEININQSENQVKIIEEEITILKMAKGLISDYSFRVDKSEFDMGGAWKVNLMRGASGSGFVVSPYGDKP